MKAAGARVLTLDQIEGLRDPTIECWTTEEEDDGDPPRLWFPNGMYPGTAFTRSIGDAAAERIGVFAEPELEFRHLGPNDAFLIIASDGVFEFISSQRVVDMVSCSWHSYICCYKASHCFAKVNSVCLPGLRPARASSCVADSASKTPTATCTSHYRLLAGFNCLQELHDNVRILQVSKFDDPHEACLSVVAESYRLWLQYETRTDDITMIMLQFGGLDIPSRSASLQNRYDAHLGLHARSYLGLLAC